MGVASEVDPPSFNGFTHLLEHMLFSGSTNFPEDNYLEKVIKKYNGKKNGSTGDFITTFYYSLSHEGLDEFFEALADAFKNPLFKEEELRKELNNVNSEISMRMTFEKKKSYYKFIKAIGNPKARLFRDGFANIDPETVDFKALRKDLLDFHDKYYSPNLMKMVVVSSEDKKNLAKKIKDKFGVLENKDTPRPHFDTEFGYQPPFEEGMMGRVFLAKGVDDPSVLRLFFKTDSFKLDSGTLTREFFSILFGYYAKGSLKHTLQEEGLALGMENYAIFEDYKDGIYVFKFVLTEKGKRKVTEVLKHFYGFVDFLKQLKGREEIYDYIAKISKFGFLFNVGNAKLGMSETSRDFFYLAKSVSKFLQDYPDKELYRAGHVFSRFNDEKFNQLLNQFRPDNSIVYFESKDFKIKGEKEKTTKEAKKENKVVKEEKTKGDKVGEDKNKTVYHFPFDSIDLNKEIAKSNSVIENLLRKAKLRKKAMRRRRKHKSRFLAEEAIEERTVELTIDILNNAIEDQQLDLHFDFDDKKPYKEFILSEELIIELTTVKEQREYTVVQPTDLSYIEDYPMLTTCVPPLDLVTTPIVHNTTPLLNDPSLNSQGSSKDSEEEEIYTNYHLNTDKTYNAIFDEKNRSDSHLSPTMKSFNNFKKCVRKDVLADVKDHQLHLLSKSPSSSLYHKLYRKSMQPKYISIVTIESDYLLEKVMIGKSGRIEASLTSEILCSYLNRDIELEFHEDYLKSCYFNCRAINYELVLTFQGISTLVEDFSIRVLTYIKALRDINPVLLDIVKDYYKNYFNDFDTKMAKPLAKYYLNVFMDRLIADYSDDVGRDYYSQTVRSVNQTTLVEFIIMIFRKTKIMVSAVGNVSKRQSEQMSIAVNKAMGINRGQKIKHHPALNDSYYKMVLLDNLVTKFAVDEHLVVRLPNNDAKETNNVYLTYFKFGSLDKRDKLMLDVLNHLLKDFAFNRLRNELNLGYVASSYICDFHIVG